ncbi:hypothetical protein P0O24_06430 [Methanotrichaceae archaeon M04Ac]|uniref:Uncharacterized protein n=1 Tax=Candidatus Methanocrinis alkalitolerans TaxID=3033395 RepID=A0ABT5XEW4_9EURY|nr:hypothetical protein [Candidatus Methanocrinis alkalitolerans]MDF0593215.1 hypothetical protein [Candidatus Methanocrinis alkalitolerans]
MQRGGGKVNISTWAIQAQGSKIREDAPRRSAEIVVLPSLDRGGELDRRMRS